MSFKISSNPKCPCLCHSCLLFPRLCTGCACRSLEYLQAAGQALCSQSCWQVIPWVIVFSCPHLAVYCSQPFPDSSGHSPSLFWAGRMWHRVPPACYPCAGLQLPPQGRPGGKEEPKPVFPKRDKSGEMTEDRPAVMGRQCLPHLLRWVLGRGVLWWPVNGHSGGSSVAGTHHSCWCPGTGGASQCIPRLP